MEQTVFKNEMATFSKLLQMTMLNAQAFSKAVEKEMIVINSDGTLKWTLENKTLLAYFLGRLFSGDHGKYSKMKGMLWLRGKKTFPATELQELFGEPSLRKLRDNREGRLLPEHFELVDELF